MFNLREGVELSFGCCSRVLADMNFREAIKSDNRWQHSLGHLRNLTNYLCFTTAPFEKTLLSF